MTTTPQRVLVVRIDKVGDLVLATPAIRNLRDAWPAARLSVMASTENAAVVEGWAVVDELVQYDRAWSVSQKLRTLTALRSRRFDVVLVLSPTVESYMAAFLTGAAVRSGIVYSRRVAARCLSPLLLSRASVMSIDEAIARGAPVPHEVTQSLAAVEALGIQPRNAPLELSVGESDREWAAALIAREASGPACLALHLSNGWFATGGSGEDMRGLIDRLLAQLPIDSIVVTHGAADALAFERLRATVALEPVCTHDGAIVHRTRDRRLVVVGGLPFARWAALLAQGRVVISRDTGALHVGAAMGRPVVAIYEARTFRHCSQQWAPWMVPHRSLCACEWAVLTPAIAGAAAGLLAACSSSPRCSTPPARPAWSSSI